VNRPICPKLNPRDMLVSSLVTGLGPRRAQANLHLQHMTFQEKLLNFLLFQSGWWACILSVKYDLELAALLFTGILTLLQLRWGSHARANLRIIAWVLPLGIALDSLLQIFMGWTFYGWSIAYLSPFWLWMIWVLFAITLKSSMAFLNHLHPLLQACIGLVMGPISYIAGAELGAASMPSNPSGVYVLALAWAVITPIVMKRSKNQDLA